MIRRLLFCLVLLVSLGVGAAPAGATVEHIVSYDITADLTADNVLHVTEKIVYDFGPLQRHGIYRSVPVRYRYDNTYDRVYPLHVESVTASPGTPTGFEVESEAGQDKIRIGDPDKTITGQHTYTIRYTLRGVANGFDEHDELYWNALGDQWPVSIDSATVTVTLPAGATKTACFSGPTGSSSPCERDTPDGRQATFGQSNLSPYQALTVVAAFPKGAVTNPKPLLEERWSLARAFSPKPVAVGVAAVGGILAIAFVIGLTWRKGRDVRSVGSATDVAFGVDGGEQQRVGLGEKSLTPVEYEPPDGIKPGQVGTLVDEVANPLDVTATIIDLAVHGYLRIEEIPKQGWFGKPDWNLTRLRADYDGLHAYERSLLSGLFGSGEEVKLSELKNSFYKKLARVQDELYDDVVAQGWFPTRPDKVRSRWQGIGVLVTIVGVGVLALLAWLTKWALVGVPIPILGLCLIIAAKRMPHRSAKGTAVLRRVWGFKRLIDGSEKDRARWAEEKNILNLFSEYLPYAIVFGCVDKWAKVFGDLGLQPQTDWYSSPHAFDMVMFSHAIGGFTTTTSGTIVSTPSSSGSSGFGGGGSSGGGFGGGGGGSW